MVKLLIIWYVWTTGMYVVSWNPCINLFPEASWPWMTLNFPLGWKSYDYKWEGKPRQ